MNALIITNPKSGVGKSKKILDSIVIPKLEFNKISYKCLLTKYQFHATKLVESEQLNDFDLILVLGGDGTMHEVVNGMLNRNDKINIPIGLLPTGSGNSLLHDRENTDILESLNLILQYNISSIDILKINTPKQIFYSINLMGWGMVNDINILAEKMRWMGPIRYNVSSIIEIFRYSPRYAEIEIDSKIYNDKYAFIIACNTIHIGKGMKMAPHARLDDGKMDLIIIKNNFNRIKLLKMFPTLFTGNHINDPLVEYRQAKSLKLTPNTNTILNIDGEMIGETPITIEVVPGIIKLLN